MRIHNIVGAINRVGYMMYPENFPLSLLTMQILIAVCLALWAFIGSRPKFGDTE